MLPPILELVAFPFVAGAVGYLTNKLAIKMLFRPYEPKWYTCGWQGIVPKTRPMLAKKVGKMVSSHLLSPQDVENALMTQSFQSFAQASLAKKLKEMTPDDVTRLIPFDSIKKAIENNADALNPMINGFIQQILDCESFKTYIASKVAEAISSEETLSAISNEISLRINNFIHSGATLEEALPSAILAQKDKITDYIAQAAENAFKQTGRSVDVKNAAAEKIIAFKDSFFSNSGADQFKMGLFSMFLDDEMISNAVKREMPTVLDGIVENPAVREKIRTAINSEIELLLKMKLSELADKASHGTLHSLFSSLKTNMTSERFRNDTKQSAYSFVEKKLIHVNSKNNLNINISEIINSLFNQKLVDNLSSYTAKYVSTHAEGIACAFISRSTVALKGYIAPAFERLNIGEIVENKINSLQLSEVEDVLFSFMRSHFKWINILGFFIGFVIGAIQTVVIILSK